MWDKIDYREPLSGQDFRDDHEAGKGCLIWFIVGVIVVILTVVSIFV